MNLHSAQLKSDIETLENGLPSFSQSIQTPLLELEASCASKPLVEYVATGNTPQRRDWSYPTCLPRTGSHDSLLAKLRGLPETRPAAASSPRKIASPKKMLSPRKGFSSPSKLPSPTKTRVFLDEAATVPQVVPQSQSSNDPAEEAKGGLREMDMNVLVQPSSTDEMHGHPPTSFSKSVSMMMQQPPLKRHATADSRLPRKGRENSVMSQSVGPGFGMGRRLRSSPQQ